jgi:hypothetical protein
LLLTQNVSFAQLDVVSGQTPAYYDKEYYDNDYSEPEAEVKSEEHNLSELVNAWKEAEYTVLVSSAPLLLPQQKLVIDAKCEFCAVRCCV